MNKKLHLAAFLGIGGLALTGLAQVPAAPKNLHAEVSGQAVSLTWENADFGKELYYTSFEGEYEDFPFEGWSVITTDEVDPIATWFQFPGPKFEESENLELYYGTGVASAAVWFDPFVPRGEDAVISAYQDEWLVSPVIDNAAYVKFSFYIKPTLLEDGQYEEFKNHFYIMVTDDGENWEPVWDARYDMLNIDGFQTAVVCLGEPSPTKQFAFVAQSNPDDTTYGLFYAWCVDDVYVYDSKPDAEAGPVALKPAPLGKTFIPFDKTGLTPSLQPQPMHREPMDKPLAFYYNIYRDGTLLVANYHATYFTDDDAKDDGDYVYEVRAVGFDGESEPATAEVHIGGYEFAAPTDFKVWSSFDEDTNYYLIHMSFGDAKSDFKPDFYEIITDGQRCAYFVYDGSDNYGVSFSHVVPGTYQYEACAVYNNPEGVSPYVGQWITVGTRSTVTGMTTVANGNDVTIEWGNPTEPDLDELTGFDVYRNGTCIAENIEGNTFTDTNVPNGLYSYAVACRYSDGSVSSFLKQEQKIGDSLAVYPLPYSEDFNSGFQPENWSVYTYETQTPPKYYFSFDNAFDIEVYGGGFDGGFVSATSNLPGFYIIADYLQSPFYDLSKITDRSGLTLEFDFDFLSIGGNSPSVCRLEYSVDGGETWVQWGDDSTVPYYTELDLAEIGEFCNPQFFSMKFGDVATAETISFRLLYLSFFDYHFALDNWKVYDANGAGVGTLSAEDSSIRITRRADSIVAAADSEILSLEVYDLTGSKIACVSGNGNAVVNIDGVDTAVAMVRAVTAKGVKCIKLTK